MQFLAILRLRGNTLPSVKLGLIGPAPFTGYEALFHA